MKEILLTQGKVALVDDDDYGKLSKWTWYAIKGDKTWYAARSAPRKEGHRVVRMHRIIMDAPAEMEVDHIDLNGLNNQRDNLRVANGQHNSYNKGLATNNTSGFKGVVWSVRSGKWVAKIGSDGKRTHLGYFESVVKAACAYDDAARELHGEFAKVNFPR